MGTRKLKISFATHKGIMFGVAFPFTDYVDVTICFAFFAMHIKFKSR